MDSFQQGNLVPVLCGNHTSLDLFREMLEQYDIRGVVCIFDEADAHFTNRVTPAAVGGAAAFTLRESAVVKLTSLPPVTGIGSRLFSLTNVSALRDAL